jgi:hypothetical protein
MKKLVTTAIVLGSLGMMPLANAANMTVVTVHNWTHQPLTVLKTTTRNTTVSPAENGKLNPGASPMVVTNHARTSIATITIGMDWAHYCQFTTSYEKIPFSGRYQAVVNEKKGIKTCHISGQSGVYTLHFGTE